MQTRNFIFTFLVLSFFNATSTFANNDFSINTENLQNELLKPLQAKKISNISFTYQSKYFDVDYSWENGSEFIDMTQEVSEGYWTTVHNGMMPIPLRISSKKFYQRIIGLTRAKDSEEKSRKLEKIRNEVIQQYGKWDNWPYEIRNEFNNKAHKLDKEYGFQAQYIRAAMDADSGRVEIPTTIEITAETSKGTIAYKCVGNQVYDFNRNIFYGDELIQISKCNGIAINKSFRVYETDPKALTINFNGDGLRYFNTPAYCLTPETKISVMNDGNVTQVEIKNVRVGDLVQSIDPRVNQLTKTKVKEIFHYTVNERFYTFTLENGVTITMTGKHPVYVRTLAQNSFEYLPAEEIRTDAILLHINKGIYTYAKIASIYIEPRQQEVYNLHVVDKDGLDLNTDLENFIANGIVVHNKD